MPFSEAELAGAEKEAAAAEADDLDSLVAQAPAPHAQEQASNDDESIDLGALAALSSSARPNAGAGEDADEAVVVVAPAAVPKLVAPAVSPAPRPQWLLPLLIGFLAGMPAGAWFFAAPAAQDPGAQTAGVADAPAQPPPPAPPPMAAVAAQLPSRPSSRPSVQAAPAAPVAAVARPVASGQPAVPATRAEPAAVGGSEETDPALDAELGKLVGESGPAAAEPTGSDGPAAQQPRSVDNLLDDALSPSARRMELARQTEVRQDQALAASSALPAAPTRDDVSNAMAILVPAIRGCAMGQAGLATAGIVVRNDGRVASVSVTGAPFQGSASGRCMEGVVRRARFPRFTQPAFRVQFPFAIQ